MCEPVLMLTGRYDFVIPEPLRRELFVRLGTPPGDRHRVLFDSSHSPGEVARESLAFLHRYLGPVR